MSQIFYWVLTHGDAVLFWVLTALGGLAMKGVLHFIKNSTARGITSRALTEVGDAVLEVAQTYVSDLKAASADGTLTDVEKKAAKDKAIATAKKNIGAEGLQKLEKILGVDVEGWLGTKVEAAVGALKPASGAVATLQATKPATPANPQ